MRKRCIVFCNFENKDNVEILNNVKNVIADYGIELKTLCVVGDVSEEIEADFALSIGGDGTVLYASHYLVDKAIPLISIKAGGLGFLSTIKPDNIRDFISDYLRGNYKIVDRSVLKIRFNAKTFIALNDLVIKSKTLRTFYIDVYYYDEYISSYFSDGIIISTPTGSTAYNLSSGGPIIHPDAKVIAITPISPHTLTHRPVILPSTSLIKIMARERHQKKSQIVLSIDGQKNFDYDMSVIEVGIYEKNFKTIVPLNYSYFEVLRKKLSWGERSD